MNACNAQHQKKRKQCAHCPWRKDVDPEKDIPDGYSVEKHLALKDTISDGSLQLGKPMRMMACHESKPGREVVCVGWLANQLGPGNNLGLRLMAMAGELPQYELVGEQHETFEDTLPESAR